jgi:pimeloyl-ACP methyl ester carboxylesterase
MQALRIERPALVGHSLADEELSSIGSRFPNKVSGPIYLDAAASWSFDDPAHPQVEIEMNGIKKRIEAFAEPLYRAGLSMLTKRDCHFAAGSPGQPSSEIR